MEPLIFAQKSFYSAVELLIGSVLPSIAVLALAFVGLRLRSLIQAETNWKWLSSTIASTFAICFCVFLAAYFLPAIAGLQEQGLGLLPPDLVQSPSGVAFSFAYGLFKAALAAIVVSLLLLPLELAGSFVFAWASEKLGKKSPELLRLAIASYALTVLGYFLVFFVVPEAVTGIIYLLYFGFPA